MTAPLILLGYALLVGTLGARRLQRAEWPARSPGVGILAWQAVTGSVVLAVMLAGTALALPTLPLTVDLADLLRACASALKAHYATPGGTAVAAAGAALAAGVVTRIGYCLAAGWAVTRRHRRQQRQVLELLGHRHARWGAVVVQHPTAAAYCVPGRRGQVVLTTAALTSLGEAELAAVLAHERAHLRGRHDLILAGAAALVAAFQFIPLFRTAHAQLARLVEMHADDQALGHSDRRVLATALVALSGGAHPAGALGAGGESALARVQRLGAPLRPLGRSGAAVVLVAAGALVVLPLLIVAAPAVAAAAMDYCPVGFPE